MESGAATDLERGADESGAGPTPPTESHATDAPSENADASPPRAATELVARAAEPASPGHAALAEYATEPVDRTTEPGSPASSTNSVDEDPFEVTVPLSASPGDTLHVDVGGGTELVVRVPPGAAPGQVFRVPRAKRHRDPTLPAGATTASWRHRRCRRRP